MERKPLIAGNWKMFTTVSQAVALARGVADACRTLADREVMVAPPCIALPAVAEALVGSPVILAAQNVHWAREGAFTGEISPTMLAEFGCRMAIVGHSERRHIFHEDNPMVNRRLAGALAAGMVPVFCIGETLAEREAGQTFTVLEEQVRAGLDGIELSGPADLVVAYEPVWAIGTGKTASTDQAQEVHAAVRNVLALLFEKNIAGQLRILYGGSVKPENIDDLMAQEDIDGVLVGGASLTAESFARIIHFCQA